MVCLLVCGADSFPDIGLTFGCVVGGVAPVRDNHLIVYKVLFFNNFLLLFKFNTLLAFT